MPNSAVPSMNLTISPFGGVPDEELTVAVKVTVPPKFDGLLDDESAVVVGILVTICVSRSEVLVT